MLLGVLDLVEVQLDRLGESTRRLRDRAALVGDIDLETLRHVSAFFLVDGSGEVAAYPQPFHETCLDGSWSRHLVEATLTHDLKLPVAVPVAGYASLM